MKIWTRRLALNLKTEKKGTPGDKGINRKMREEKINRETKGTKHRRYNNQNSTRNSTII